MIIREEVELIEKVPDINATKRIHLGKWENRREARKVSLVRHLQSITYLSSSLGLSGVNQLTLTTLSYSSRLAIGIGM